MKKKSVVLNAIKEEDEFWKSMAKAAMAKAWSKEDVIWNASDNQAGKTRRETLNNNSI